jgi:putative hydrolase of the HAD superfamily
MAIAAVTFDFGQTLAELDTAMLAARLEERGVSVASSSLATAVPHAWMAYDAAVTGGGGGHPWHILMNTLLSVAGVPADAAPALVDWLWSEQPRKNLWRAPIPGMIELVRALPVPVGVISNSEGRLAELAAEMGWREDFAMIADSGVLGSTKPDPGIFEWAVRELRVDAEEVVHVGDSWTADIDGALAMGMKAIWFGGATGSPPIPANRSPHDRLRFSCTALETAAALRAWGLDLAPLAGEAR